MAASAASAAELAPGWQTEAEGDGRAWTAEFFEEQSIVNTFQHLLSGSTSSVEDLCRHRKIFTCCLLLLFYNS
jgi:hypothetical protein